MLSFLEHAKIGVRISLLLVLPILGLLIFSGNSIVDKRNVVSKMESLQQLADLAPAISALVHELQKERGTSAVFVGSKGAKFAEELPRQWAASSQKRAALEQALAQFDAQPFGVDLVNKIAAAGDALSKLTGTREAVETIRSPLLRWPDTTRRPSPSF